MTNQKKLLILAGIFFLGITAVFSGCKKEAVGNILENEEKSTLAILDTVNCPCLVNPSDTVSQEEIDMLLYMREEEKLARDVYIAMYELYNIPIFKNISKSEQHHMNQVLCLLDYYEIPDPASADTGVFTNPELQELYTALIEQGSVSLTDALTVGATIEDKDIFDLDQDMAATVNPAILLTFSRLSCASGNHIRSFSAWLESRDVIYVPQYISQEQYDGIISQPHQFCGAGNVTRSSGSPSID